MKKFLIQNITTRSYLSKDLNFRGEIREAELFDTQEDAEKVMPSLMAVLPDLRGYYYQDPYVLTVIPVFIVGIITS